MMIINSAWNAATLNAETTTLNYRRGFDDDLKGETQALASNIQTSSLLHRPSTKESQVTSDSSEIACNYLSFIVIWNFYDPRSSSTGQKFFTPKVILEISGVIPFSFCLHSLHSNIFSGNSLVKRTQADGFPRAIYFPGWILVPRDCWTFTL